jgi:retron-type reverse transcriptase
MHARLDPVPVIARIAAEPALRAGWRRVRRNRGGPGGDGQAPWQFALWLDRNLARLAREIAAGSYRPGPLRVGTVVKPDGSVRQLAVPSVRDRVTQSAAVIVLAPMLTPACRRRASPIGPAFRSSRRLR